MNHVSAAFRIGGEEVEVYLSAGREDEPAALGADGKVETDAVHVVYRFVEHDTRDNSDVPAVFVVFVDMAEFDGEDNGAGFGGILLTIVGGSGDVVANDA